MRKRFKAFLLLMLAIFMCLAWGITSFATELEDADCYPVKFKGKYSNTSGKEVAYTFKNPGNTIIVPITYDKYSNHPNPYIMLHDGTGKVLKSWKMEDAAADVMSCYGASGPSVSDKVVAYIEVPFTDINTYVHIAYSKDGPQSTVSTAVGNHSNLMAFQIVKVGPASKEEPYGTVTAEDTDMIAAGMKVGDKYYRFIDTYAHGQYIKTLSSTGDLSYKNHQRVVRYRCGSYLICGFNKCYIDRDTRGRVYPYGMNSSVGWDYKKYSENKLIKISDMGYRVRSNRSEGRNEDDPTGVWMTELDVWAYHPDDNHDGLCDGCNKPTDGEDLIDHVHDYKKVYYSENGVDNAYYYEECECGVRKDNVKHYIEFTLHWDLNGGSSGSITITDKKINAGQSSAMPDVTLTRPGYTFLGWSTTRNGTKEYNQGQSVTPKKSTTYYACWEALQFQLYFDKMQEPWPPITVTYGQPIGTLPASPSGEWVEEVSGSPVDSTTVYTWTESITLIPPDNTEYITVQFISSEQSQTQQYVKGAVLSPPFTPNPGTGYTFKWWSTSRTGTEFDFSQQVFKDLTLYAVIDGNRIKVSFVGHGIVEYPYGAKLGDLPTVTQTGTEFKGWFWDSECTQPVSPDEFVPAYDVTLYPKFESVKFTVTLEGYDPIQMGQYDVFPELPEPKRDGQTFLGWYYGEQQIQKGDVYEWNFAISLRPKFASTQWPVTLPDGSVRMVYEGEVIGKIPTGSITAGTKVIGFKNQRGEVVTESTRVYEMLVISPVLERGRLALTLMNGDVVYGYKDVDAGLRITDLPSVTKDGYTFRGWSLSQGGTVTTGPFYADTTLYTVFSADKQVITLNELNQTVEKATGSPIGSLPIPTKDGYDFGGWTWNGTLITADTIVPPGGMNLYPKWDAVHIDTTKFVTIRYWSDGIRINTVDMNPGEILYDPGAPALDNLGERTFAYWSTRSGGQYQFGKRVSSDLDLYAVWN